MFEVFPEIKPKLSRWKSFEKSEITLDDTDIDLAIDDILERYCEWQKVERVAQDKDQVVIDFEGKIEGESFEGNESKDFKLVLGSKSMIPGFEDNLVGKKSGESFSFKTNFVIILFDNNSDFKTSILIMSFLLNLSKLEA